MQDKKIQDFFLCLCFLIEVAVKTIIRQNGSVCQPRQVYLGKCFLVRAPTELTRILQKTTNEDSSVAYLILNGCW